MKIKFLVLFVLRQNRGAFKEHFLEEYGALSTAKLATVRGNLGEEANLRDGVVHLCKMSAP